MSKNDFLDKLLMGYKIAYPKENIEIVLNDIILNNNLDLYVNKSNFFELEKNNLTKNDIIKILYDKWYSLLSDMDFFLLSNEYAIFIVGNNINIVGHFGFGDVEDINSSLINGLDNKDKMHAYIYPVVSPGSYEIDGVLVTVDERGKIIVHNNETEYGNLEKDSFGKYKITSVVPKYLNGEKISDEELELFVKKLSRDYIRNLDINEVFLKNGFKFFDGAFSLLSNATSLKLQDDMSGKLLGGMIDLSTNRGYETRPDMPQQDAVLSIVKNENLFLNVIADGAGGSKNGEKASKEVILELKKWFEVIPLELFEREDVIIELLKHKIYELDQRINKVYKNSYTTLVLALTVYDKTILANVGDSTVYSYFDDELQLLTKIDSETGDMEYDDARYSLWNNVITAALGDGYEQDIHINVIENNGQKIIISSDGVTDLISEDRFKSYFINDISSLQIVNDALSKKDTEWLNKTEDNISVIIVRLPDKNKVKKLV